MIRVADYIVQALVAHDVRDAFLVTGGGAMHLNDAFGRTPGMRWIACHHEQACAMAAESYFRLTRRIAAVNVTTGPGGTNAITGVYGAWVDSLAMIVVSGQVRFDTTVASTDLPLRQLGDQEADIIKLVAPITKYAVMVTDPLTIRYHVERALFLAASGRPGPVWLDIPMNVQGALVDPDVLPGFDPAAAPVKTPTSDVAEAARETIARLKAAKRPAILVGSGVRLAGAQSPMLALAGQLGVPLVTAWNAHDLVPDAHPCYAGRPGSVGDRAGNFTVQNADFLLVLGCRLNIRQIGYSYKTWARAAYKVVVDVDEAELRKPTLAIDLAVNEDVGTFLEILARVAPATPEPAHTEYLAWCQQRRERYPVVSREYRVPGAPVNPYVFMDALFADLPEGQIVVTGDGTACVAAFQAAKIREGQRLYTNSGSAPMGYDLPAAVGAFVGAKATGMPSRIICLAGDGSVMMNLQELATIKKMRMPIAIFVLNNQGYHSIRQTQTAYFPDNIIGCGPESGLGFPDFGVLARAFDFAYERIDTLEDLEKGIGATLANSGPVICEVMLDLKQAFAPKLSSRKLENGQMVSAPLEDLAPFLPRAELAQNMLIPLVQS